jgi:hypothetical protein
MIRISLAIIVLLLSLSYGYADGLPAEESERQAKEHQLGQVTDRFKSETGFRGEINYDTNRMCLGFFEGKFADIRITANADTASFRAVFEQILDKVLPFTFAKREQLSRSRITNNLGIIQTDYYQQINGYRVEGVGRLTISYEVGRNGFTIGNGTVELPNDIHINITREEAANIAVKYFKNQCNPPDYKLVPEGKEGLWFSNPDLTGYALKYIIYLGDFVYYVDANSGRLNWENAISDE